MCEHHGIACRLFLCGLSRHAKGSYERGSASVELRVFRSGLIQDRNIRVRIFPECQKILIRGAGLFFFSRQCVRAAELKMSQRTYGIADNDSAVIWNFLKLGSSFPASPCRKIGHATNVGRV